MSQGHYVRPAKEVTAPRNLVSVVITSRAATDRENPHVTPVHFQRAYAAACLWRRGHWEPIIRAEFAKPHQLHDWIEEYAADKRRTFVVSPIATDALTMSKFWPRLTEAGARFVNKPGHYLPENREERDPHTYYVMRDVMQGKPDIVSYQIGAKSITWVSGRQYFTADEEDLAKSIGFEWAPVPAQAPNTVSVSRGPWCRAKLWLHLFRDLSEWWREVGGGPWGYTAGHLGMQFFRKRLAPRIVCTHTQPQVKAMECRAIFAGRASTWFVGDIGSPRERHAALVPPPPRSYRGWIPGPVFSLDVRSMYPWLLATQYFPTKWVGLRGRMELPEALDHAEGMGIIADVVMDCQHPEYPCRLDDRIVYPTGVFRTTLTGAELAVAIKAGDVASVEQAALYAMGRPFQTMAEDLLFERQEARRKGAGAWELFVKLLSNAFTGKLAQRGGRWEQRPEVPPERDWGEFLGTSGATGRQPIYKAVAGLVSEFVYDEAFGRPLGFCYAYLTAYARLHMRQLRQHAPPDTIISQDTDGLWCLESAHRAIVGATGGYGETAGSLKLDEVQPAGRWFGPKHYWLPRGWTLSGFHHPARISSGLEFLDSFNVNPIHSIVDHAPTKVLHVTRRGTLDVHLADGRPDRHGWMRPLVLRG